MMRRCALVLIIMIGVLVISGWTAANPMARSVYRVACPQQHFSLELPSSWFVAQGCGLSNSTLQPTWYSGLMIETRDGNASVFYILRTGAWSAAQIRALDRRLGGTTVKPIQFGHRTIHQVTYLTGDYTEKTSQGNQRWWNLAVNHRTSLYEFDGNVQITHNGNSALQQQQVDEVLASIVLQ